MSKKRSLSPDHPTQSEQAEYFKSGPIEDRSSTFIGVFSPSKSATELQKLPEFRTASHRMAGWRKTSSQRTLNAGSGSTSKPIYVTGSDDDGEKYGGKRLEKVLNELNVEGAVVVTRWYGGVLLGPVRFMHTENAAREAIMVWRNSVEDSAKKQKIETDANAKERLVRDLEERDQSITTLRQLLAEKSASQPQVETSTDTKSAALTSSPATAPDYVSMPLPRLRQLDKARDATIAWILKQIDTAEAKAPQNIQENRKSAKD